MSMDSDDRREFAADPAKRTPFLKDGQVKSAWERGC